jgi:HEAT repeat protein
MPHVFAMDLQEINNALKNPDFQYRLKAITALKNFEAEVAVPILIQTLNDSEFLVRSFVAMGLSKHRTADSFAALLQLMRLDNTPSVRAEAANSLSLFGQVSISHLVTAFEKDTHWLVRRSILAAIADLNSPKDLLEICTVALKDEDFTLREATVSCLAGLAQSEQQEAALLLLLSLMQDEEWRVRVRLVYALNRFDDPSAKQALENLRQDEEPRVVAATWEQGVSILPEA